MDHLDRDEEDEDGEANANARNKAITSLLRGPKPRNHNHSNHAAPVETDDEESEDEDPPAVRTLFVFLMVSATMLEICGGVCYAGLKVPENDRLKQTDFYCMHTHKDAHTIEHLLDFPL